MTASRTSAIKPKHQRLVLIGAAIVALFSAGLLAAWALRNQASYFYVPTELTRNPPAPGRDVRLGGMVERGSLKQQSDQISVRFIVADGTARVPVRFTGIAPELFQEGSGVVAEGRLGRDGTFIAERLLAKHDENYVPREMKNMSATQAQLVVAETK